MVNHELPMPASRHRRLRSIVAAMLLVLVVVGCGEDAFLRDAAAPEAVDQPTCGQPSPLNEDPFDLARRVIDATTAWDVPLLCSLIGVAQVPSGLVRYHEALVGGLSRELERVGSKVDAESAAYNFDIPERDGGYRLGLGFHQQSGGWALTIAVFVPRP